MECEHCNGFGYTEFLVNSTGYHFNGEEPIIEKEPCEYCNSDDDDDEINHDGEIHGDYGDRD